MNYSAYNTNFTYHIIVEILFKISEQERSGSSRFFSNSSITEQYEIIKNKLNEKLNGQVKNRNIMKFTYFLRQLGILEKSGYIPTLRDHIWRGIFLLSLSDVLSNYGSAHDILITDLIINEIRVPLFLTKNCIYEYLNMEVLHPYFRINQAKGNEIYIQIKENVNLNTILRNEI